LVSFWIKDVKRKRRWVFFCVGWFLIFSNPYIIHKLTLSWQAGPKELKPSEHYTVGIVLSGFAAFDYETRRGYFGAASDRFIQAVRLYQQKKIEKILITGGSGSLNHQQYKEADFVKEQLEQMGIPAADILSENQSRNTFENASYTEKILDSAQLKGPYLLITSALHMKRALAVFHKQQIPVVGYPCNFTAINNTPDFSEAVLPSYNAFEGWDNYLKEVVGLLIYKLTGKA
jgi:uncharacterized SAM-binding protein YcdF (DUF218 family)